MEGVQGQDFRMYYGFQGMLINSRFWELWYQGVVLNLVYIGIIWDIGKINV